MAGEGLVAQIGAALGLSCLNNGIQEDKSRLHELDAELQEGEVRRRLCHLGTHRAGSA
jgi:hypothetical protein